MDAKEPQSEKTSKSCSKCKEVKELSLFSRLARSKDGRQSACKACLSAYMRDYSKKKSQIVQNFKSGHTFERMDELKKEIDELRNELSEMRAFVYYFMKLDTPPDSPISK